MQKKEILSSHKQLVKVLKRYTVLQYANDERSDLLWSIQVGWWLMFMEASKNKMTLLESPDSGWWKENYKTQERFIKEMRDVGFGIVVSDDSAKKHNRYQNYLAQGENVQMNGIDFIML